MRDKNSALIFCLIGLFAGLTLSHMSSAAAIPIPKVKPRSLESSSTPASAPSPSEVFQSPQILKAPQQHETSMSSLPLNVQVTKEFGQIKVSLTPFDPKTGFSLFRSQNMWVFVSTGHYDIKIDSFQADNVAPLQEVRALDHQDCTVLIFHISPTYTPKISMENQKFSLIFAETAFPFSPPSILPPLKINDPVIINFQDADEEFTIYDSETGKNFIGYTSDKHHAPIQEFTYPEIKLLPSLQGIAFETISDHVTVQNAQGKFQIFGISATPNQPHNPSPVIPYPFSLFEEFELNDGVRQKQQLESRLQGKNTIANHIQLALIDLALGYIPETSATLENLAKTYPQITFHPIYATFSGLSKLFLHGERKFTHENRSYFRDRELGMITNLIDIADHPYESSGNMIPLLNIKPFLISLPQQLKDDLITFILIHGIYNKNLDVLSTYLKEDFIPQDSAKLPYYQLAYAVYLSLVNKPKKALAYYQALAKNFETPFIAVFAEYELVKQKLAENKIAPRSAIEILDRLRFQWRGDILEYYITKTLIDVLWSEQDFPKALGIMRKLIRYFPNQTQNDRIFQKMQEGLLQYFTKDTPTNLLEMLSVFQEFGDIAPDTAQGDQVLLKAIEAMVQLNLYGEAARLLKSYLKKKAKSGMDAVDRQAKILLRVAAVEIMDKKGDEALKILKNAESWPLPFKTHALELKADAFITAKRFEEALAIIPNEPAFELKRAHIYFKMNNWEQAAHSFLKALETSQEDKTRKAQIITNLAICYNFQERPDLLKEVKKQYAEFMAETPQKDVFAFLTTTSSPSQAKDLVTKLAYIDNLTNLAEHILHDTKATQTS